MSKFIAGVALVLFTALAQASDHESVLNARQQGNIVSFDDLLSVAHLAAGGQTVLLDARFEVVQSKSQVDIYLRRLVSDQVIVVTVDAETAEVIRIADRKISAAAAADRHDTAKSRPNDPPKSNSKAGADLESENRGSQSRKSGNRGSGSKGAGGKGSKDNGKDGRSGGRNGGGGKSGKKSGSGK